MNATFTSSLYTIVLLPVTESASTEPTSSASVSTPLAKIDDIIVGICMFVCSILCIFPNLAVMLAIKKDKELYRMNAYKLMIFMSYFDIAQLVIHAITGVFNCFQTTFSYTFAKLLGAVASPSYITYAVLTIILSINRLTQLCFPRVDKVMFSEKAMIFWYIVGFVCFGVFCCVFASPLATIIYFPAQWSWDYDFKRYPRSKIVQTVAIIIELGGIPVSGLIYCYVFLVLVIKRRKLTTSKDHKAELKILIQAFIITLYCSAMNFMWHNYSIVLPETKVAYSLLNFMWIFNGVVNPIIYSIVNTTIRKNISLSFGSKDHVTLVTKSPTAFFATEKNKNQNSVHINANPVNGQRKLVFVT